MVVLHHLQQTIPPTTTQAPTPTTNTNTHNHACKHVQGFVLCAAYPVPEGIARTTHVNTIDIMVPTRHKTTAGHRPPTACFPSHMPRYLLAKADDPLAKARCKTRSQAKADGNRECFVCGILMDSWEQANRGFACPRCKISVHLLCSEVCTLCHEDFCPICVAGKHDCPAAAAATPPEKTR